MTVRRYVEARRTRLWVILGGAAAFFAFGLWMYRQATLRGDMGL